jgi:hypothetical protein
MSKNKLAEVRQCRFSQGVVFFKENFMRHWQLAEYSHSFMPALFCGIYNGQDIKAVNEHGGVAMVMPCGSDIHNVRHIRADAIIVCSDNDLPAISSLFKGRIKKTIRIAMKDYSAFKPVRLGDKIYAYCPPKRKEHFRAEVLDRLVLYYGADSFIIGGDGWLSPEALHDNYYAHSFINIQLNPSAGFTTALEMAHMGRFSVSNHAARFTIPFKGEDDIKSAIEMHSKHIGEMRTIDMSGFFHTGRDWLSAEFWE